MTSATALTALLVCLAGGLGAALRLVFDGSIKARVRSTYPVAATLINLTGSLLLGLLTGLAAYQLLTPQWQLVAGTGLLGGYTTFSTASIETVRLVRAGQRRVALAHSLGMLVTGTASAALGLLAGLALAG